MHARTHAPACTHVTTCEQIDGNLNDAVEKWVVVLFTSTPLYTVFVVAYFLGGEVLCSVMVTCQVRR